MEKNYFIELLNENIDLKYKEFNDKIVQTSKTTFGVRIPILRKIAKTLNNCKEDFYDLKFFDCYEYCVVYLLLLGKEKNYNYFMEKLNKILPYLDSWALTDLAGEFKVVKNNLELFWFKTVECIKSDKPFISRFGFIVLMKFYICKENLTKIFNLIQENQSDDYYVSMGISWLLAEIYLLFPNEVLCFLPKTNKFINNKSIQKICESFRVSNEDKIRIKNLKKF